MNTTFLGGMLMAAILLASCASRTNIPAPAWTEANARRHIIDREDSLTWDREMFEEDLRWSEDSDRQLPMSGIFPEPRYDTQMEGTCGGVGCGGGERMLEGRKIFYDYLLVGRNINNAPFIGDKENEVFFLILTLTDTDGCWEDSGSSSMSSRNNPDFMGMGSLPVKNSKVDYIAFLTANRDNYAIVNTRLFDLRFGRTVLIAPQEDGSFRSMQLEAPLMGSEDVEAYVDSTLGKPEVHGFFLAPGSIE